MAQVNTTNAAILYDYLVAQQNELNIKESTKENIIKRIIWLSAFLNHKTFSEITKDDILSYLNTRVKKHASIDATHKWIGTYNGTQMVFSTFFKWLYNPEESDTRKRITPPCMRGIKRLLRQEKSPYKPSDLWNPDEHSIFLKYCPNKRDVCYHAMANDTSARPGELLNLRISDIVFKLSDSDVQYAEITVSGKTQSRTLPLITSIPYLKEWLQNHPAGSNPNSWLFVSLSKNNFLAKLSPSALLAQYKYHYKKNFFPRLLENDTILPRDKALIRNMLTKPFSLYVFRHSALTEKSQLLKESTLRQYAGWTITSKMPQVYLHYFGNESSKSLLEVYGIEQNQQQQFKTLKPKPCPNCSEPNKPESRFCAKCKMVLTYDAYKETIEEKAQKDKQIEDLAKRQEQFEAMIQTFIDSGQLKPAI